MRYDAYVITCLTNLHAGSGDAHGSSGEEAATIEWGHAGSPFVVRSGSSMT